MIVFFLSFFSPPNVFIYLKDTVTQREEETERWREIQRGWGGRERETERDLPYAAALAKQPQQPELG